MSGNQVVVLKSSGIYTHPNTLSAAPSGSMQEALNVVIDRNEIVEPRRGLVQYGSTFGVPSVDYAKQLINYKDIIFRHVLSKLQFDSDINGDFRDIINSDTLIQEIQAGLRIKSIEANGNLYLTTKTGIKKISARNRLDLLNVGVSEAGGIKGLDIVVTPNFSEPGFLEPNCKVAYRVVFGYKDLNDNLILGSPSAPTQIYNGATTSCFTDLKFSLPQALTTKYFYQIYRTGLSRSDITTVEPGDPGDEMNLVFEDNITAANILAGYIVTQDVTPEDFRKSGTLLYTNPVSGEGIAQSNERPPFAKDITLYKGYTFYGNTSSVQRLTFSLLTISTINNTSTFTITDNGLVSTTYTFQGTVNTFTANYTGATTANLYNPVPPPTAPLVAKYFTIISANDERKYYVWNYASANDVDPTLLVPALAGYIGIKVILAPTTDTVTTIIGKTNASILDATDDFNTSISGNILTLVCSNNGPVTVAPTENINSFTISSNGLGTGEDSTTNKVFLPRVPTGTENGPTVGQQIEQLTKSLMRVINAKDPIVAGYYQSTYLSVPGQMLLEGRETVGPVFYLYSSFGASFTPTIPINSTLPNQVFSSNEVKPNRIMFSKYQQPEAVPLANFIDVGPKDRGVNRIIALRDSLFILKEDGVYRLSGDVAPFSVMTFDFSIQILAPDSVVVLNNQIYALSTQGVIRITEGGVDVISRPIEDKLLNVFRDGFNYKSISFGVSYESDRSYQLFLPTVKSDTYATQSFRYNTFTNTWTRADHNANCGIVNFGDNKLYIGPGDLNVVEKERKSLTRTDYADRQFTKSIIQVQDHKVEIDSLTNVTPGDVLIQKQYVTIDQYNRLLEKLDDDQFITDKTYISALKLLPGGKIRNAIENLALKLDLDTNVFFNNYFSLIDTYTNTITSIVAGTTSTLLNISGTNNIKVGRYVTINNASTFPNLNKSYKVIAVSTTSITIDTVLNYVYSTVSTITITTDIQNFQDVQGCHNLITNQLNIDNGVNYKNYPTSVGLVEFEQNIDGLDKIQRQLLVSENQNLLFGTIEVYNAIQTVVVYNPQFFGDVSTDKQVREGTAIFENDEFSTFIVSYSSDKFPAFIDTVFTRPGSGDYGQFPYDETNYGGIAAPIPLRTYVPLQTQRCRFINIKLKHRVAMEKYSLFGFSLNYRVYNIRTTK